MLVLSLLGLASGFCSAWLGVGGSVFIVPLLPFLSGLDPLSALQISLLLIFVISFFNSLAFIFQKLVLWSWFVRGVISALIFSFFSGFFVTYLSHFQIRFVLCLFLLFILSLPLLLKKVPVLKNQGIYIFSSLMGVCSGLTGMGGGMILSPYLHESGKLPVQNIPAVVSCIMFFVSSFSLLGQASRMEVSFGNSPHWWLCFFLLLLPAFCGLSMGYFANIRQKNIKWRRLFLRFIVAIMFLKLTAELAGEFYNIPYLSVGVWKTFFLIFDLKGFSC